MLEEQDAEIAALRIRERVLLAALEPFAKLAAFFEANQFGPRMEDFEPLITQSCKIKDAEFTVGDIRRAAAAYPTHSEGGGTLRAQAEANVLAVRSWDSPGFEACVTAEMDRLNVPQMLLRDIKSNIAKRHRDNHDTSPPCAAEPDLELGDVKAALETLGASPSPSALMEEG